MKDDAKMPTPILEEIAEGKGQSLTQLAKLIPSRRKGRPVTLSCILRWVLDGIEAPNGERVRMEALKTPSGWISTPAALTRFLSALTPRFDSSDPLERMPP